MIKNGEDQSLAGISVLVTRALEQSAGLVEDLTSKGAHVTVIPAVAISPLPEPEGFSEVMARVGLYENVVFTSVNGVDFTLRLLADRGMGPRDLPPALCVGEKTADAWEEAGGEVAVVPERFTAQALLDVLSMDLGGNSFLVMRPEVVKTELGQAMKARGAEVDEVVIYRTVAPDEGAEAIRELMAVGGPDVVFFASPSAIAGILAMAAQSPMPKAQRESGRQNAEPGTQHSDRGILDIPAICIGPTTAKAAEEAGFTEIYFPDEHTAEGMVNELIVISGALRNKI